MSAHAKRVKWPQQDKTDSTHVRNVNWLLWLEVCIFTPEDNRADFGSISPLLTFLGNVRIILMNLKIYLFRFIRGVRCVKSDWIRHRSRIVNIQHVEYLRSEILMCGGNPRTSARLICRLSRETKQYPIRKHNKRSHGAAQKDLDTIIAISSCHYQRLGLCHYFKALNLLFD